MKIKVGDILVRHASTPKKELSIPPDRLEVVAFSEKYVILKQGNGSELVKTFHALSNYKVV